MKMRTLRFVTAGLLLLALVYACMHPSQDVHARAAATMVIEAPNVLIYCDGSPGTLAETVALQSMIQEAGGEWSYAESEQDFAEDLSQSGWTAVHVLARKAATEPAYLTALRTYAGANPEVPVQLFIWKPHLSQPAADEAVLATSALVTWKKDWSSITYALAKSTHLPLVANGLRYPDFADVETDAHVVLASFAEVPDCAQAAMMFLPIVPPCVLQCYQAYVERIISCNSDFEGDQELCESLHGPPPGGGVGDPEELEACIQRYTGYWQQCRARALSRYRDCIKKNCPPPASQPAQ